MEEQSCLSCLSSVPMSELVGDESLTPISILQLTPVGKSRSWSINIPIQVYRMMPFLHPLIAMTSTQFPLDHAKYHDCLNTSWLAILESIMAIKWKPPQKALSFPPQLLLFGNRVVWWSGHCNATSAASPYPPQALPQSRSPDWSGILAFLSLYLSFSSSITTATTWAICKPPQTRHTTMSSFATPSPHSPRPFFKRPAYPSFKVGRVGKL